MNFDAAVTLLLSDKVEGGYSNNRLDPGGETRWGITKRKAFQYGYKGDMRFYPKELAIPIYRAEYWNGLRCDEMPDPLRYPLFDGAVNEGVERMTEFLREITSMSGDKMDDALMVAVGTIDAWSLTCAIMAKRIRHYTSLPTWGMFGRGWMNRMATNLEVDSNLKGEL